ncbi:MAG: hypothetical protein ACI9KN_001884 [Gammaproteobacteria bacterium]|jgi:hypothetical protein
MVYKKSTAVERAWLICLRSDYRFGHYRAYPVFGVCLQSAKDWDLQLALPDFSILKRFNQGISLELFAKPVGDHWHVFSKDLSADSNFSYNALSFGLSTQWHITR